MKRTRYRAPAALLTAGLAVAVFAAPSGAAPAAQPITTATGAVTAAEVTAVTDFWTPERMRSATPMDALTVEASALTTVPAGVPTTVTPTRAGIQAFPNGGSAWTGAGAVVQTAGRVFFTYQGRTASCSGNAVTSTNKSTVMTAGHCVKLDGAFHTNVAFVPAYNNGNAPYGTWTARLTRATPQWVASEDINYDVGTAVVNQLNGQFLTDVVGGQGVTFNGSRAQNMYAFGWPAAAPYDGTRMIYCSGRTFSAFISTGVGMTCNMTGGASGGPWFVNFSETTGLGTQNSVNSYKINFFPNWMFGPYFGTDAQTLYNTSQTL
jgi:V8-like Glu-specific endopeptidase